MNARDTFANIITDRPPAQDLFGRAERLWRVIYAAPKWRFEHYSDDDQASRTSYDDMLRLPVSSISEADAVLFLWAPDTMTDKALALIRAWGFSYRGVAFHWAKTREATDLTAMHYQRDLPMSTGYITRGNVEPLLIATRGDPKLRKHLINGRYASRGDIRKLQFAPREKGGTRPEKFKALIEEIYDGPYLSLYDPRPRPEWGSWMPNVAVPRSPDDEDADVEAKKAARGLLL